MKWGEDLKDRVHRRIEGRGRLTQGRGIPFRAAAVKAACIAAFCCMAAGVFPLNASARGSIATSSAQVEVGTLPLLAALGIGIVVAVGAVIAFLQLTLRTRGAGDPALLSAEENESYEAGPAYDWNARDTVTDESSEQHTLADYTIPITRILEEPIEVQQAAEDEPRLCGIAGEHAGICYRVVNRRLSIGRDPAQCAVVFPYAAGEVSRKHCTLRYSEDSGLFFLEDHGSSNGTFLWNGERLEPGKTYELRAGDRFSLSGTEHCFEVRG
ncbi:hypothetical protein SD71_02480 [Cohnella kolymensis]|uniref:FHA domain-containing protein n=1 Tax=Cohnella kolymensis TaxID=1590652 RepID=A0ABR5AA01_9BACL|nr:FHA domain-containing protein [Cohnella kolymensis]KIL37518.1 hypothetical protein SD71_02480 [Cohnella kolymensis]